MTAHAPTGLRTVAAKATAPPDEVLTLRLGGEEYGIDILCLQEIRSYERPTGIAGAPLHVLGVTNLRGVIAPIVDLRCRFGIDAAVDSDTVTAMLGLRGLTAGAVVDAVSEVVSLAPGQIKPAPAFISGIEASHITGVATLGEGERVRMLILVDIEPLLTGTEMGSVGQALR